MSPLVRPGHCRADYSPTRRERVKSATVPTMARLDEAKLLARQRFCEGDHLAALRVCTAICDQEPTDFESWLKAADCLAMLGEAQHAITLYRQVGWYVLRAGHPLAALVVARVLESMEAEADDLLAALVVRYGSESELVGGLAARISLPANTNEIELPDLTSVPPQDLRTRIVSAAERLSDYDGFPG